MEVLTESPLSFYIYLWRVCMHACWHTWHDACGGHDNLQESVLSCYHVGVGSTKWSCQAGQLAPLLSKPSHWKVHSVHLCGYLDNIISILFQNPSRLSHSQRIELSLFCWMAVPHRVHNSLEKIFFFQWIAWLTGSVHFPARCAQTQGKRQLMPFELEPQPSREVRAGKSSQQSVPFSLCSLCSQLMKGKGFPFQPDIKRFWPGVPWARILLAGGINQTHFTPLCLSEVVVSLTQPHSLDLIKTQFPLLFNLWGLACRIKRLQTKSPICETLLNSSCYDAYLVLH